MATISTPASIFDHTLDPIAGYDTQAGHRLDYTAPMSADVTIVPYAGRVVWLDDTGKWQMGCKADKMPCFLMPPSHPYGHLPTVAEQGPAAGWQSIGTFPFTALPASGGYELATTEFNTARTYLPNQYLTAAANNTVQGTAGVLTNVVPGGSTALTLPYKSGGQTKTICGMVTRPAERLRNGNTVLSFWTFPIIGTTDS